MREEASGALPGQAIAVLDPQRELVVDVFPLEDAHAQERSMFPLILETVKANEVWICDRNFCTKDFLTGISERGGYFIVREHLGLAWTETTARQEAGKNASGSIFEQQVQLDSGLCVRRITIQLEEQTRHGDWQVTLFTNLPETEVTASKVSELYLKRWQIEKMFQVITDTFNCVAQNSGLSQSGSIRFLYGADGV